MTLSNRSRNALQVPFGLRDGRLYEPLQVENGLKCGCVCPGCGTALVAKHVPSGKVRPYFSHAADAACSAGLESALHLAAKQLISARRELYFPELVADVSAFGASGTQFSHRSVLREAALIPLTDVRVEESLGAIRPDLIAIAEAEEVLVEVAFTSFVTPEKLERIRELGRPAVEVDISGLTELNFDSLAVVLFTQAGKTTWVWHPEAARVKEGLQQALAGDLERDQLEWDKAQELARAEQERVDRENEKADQEFEEGWREEQRELAAIAAADRAKQAQARRNARARAAEFVALPETGKLERALAALGPAGPGVREFLPIPVRAGSAIAARPLVWQTAAFAALVHPALKQGTVELSADRVRGWLGERFKVQAEDKGFGIAVWDFLDGLSTFNVLHRIVRQDFLVAVPDVVGAIVVAMDAKDHGIRQLQWSRDWPSKEKAKALAEVFGRIYRGRSGWEKVAGLIPDVRRTEPPLSTMRYYNGQLGLNLAALRRFFLVTGFTTFGRE